MQAYDKFIKSDTLQAADVQYKIANTYYGAKSYDEVLLHGMNSLSLFQKISYSQIPLWGKNDYMSLLNTIALAHSGKGQYDSAIHYFTSSGEMARINNNEFWEVFSDLSFNEATKTATYAMQQFLNGEFDRVDLIYNEFKNVATQILKVEQFLPMCRYFRHKIMFAT